MESKSEKYKNWIGERIINKTQFSLVNKNHKNRWTTMVIQYKVKYFCYRIQYLYIISLHKLYM